MGLRSGRPVWGRPERWHVAAPLQACARVWGAELLAWGSRCLSLVPAVLSSPGMGMRRARWRTHGLCRRRGCRDACISPDAGPCKLSPKASSAPSSGLCLLC